MSFLAPYHWSARIARFQLRPPQQCQPLIDFVPLSCWRKNGQVDQEGLIHPLVIHSDGLTTVAEANFTILTDVLTRMLRHKAPERL